MEIYVIAIRKIKEQLKIDFYYNIEEKQNLPKPEELQNENPLENKESKYNKLKFF